jgi:peptidoglycan hydrolase-like protein with peptidoglycan-binding domain
VDTSGLNWRGVVVFGLAVLTVIVLIAVIDDQPATLGINTIGAGDDTTATTLPGETTTTVAGATTTTAPGATTTTKAGATTTTKPGATTTTAFNPAGKPQLQQGASGNDVVFLQQQLVKLGYLPASPAPDGSFGAQTTQAVIKFQQDKGISPADGVVGPQTWTALSTATKS